MKPLNTLTVKLDEKLASPAIPDSDCTILTTSQDIILIGVDGCDGATMRICDIPKLSLGVDCVEAAEEAVSIAYKHCIVVLSEEDPTCT